jgi:hypothetical protein
MALVMWHCPHCGAPQAETARCWVCHRSSTTCSTCRHFRASLAADVSYCALDRRRRPLTGLELRGCWSEHPSSIQAAARMASVGPGRRFAEASVAAVSASGAGGFVPIEDVRPNRRDAPTEPQTATTPAEAAGTAPDEGGVTFIVLEPGDGWESRTSLFGEPEH